MVLFRMMNLNVANTFMYLSYSPLFFIYFIFMFFMFFGLSLWTFFFDFMSVMLFLILLFITIFFLFLDILTDNMYGMNEGTSLYSMIQHCFVWFMLSEAALFLSFFWAAFVLNLLVTMEYSTLYTPVPLLYSFLISNTGFIFYWFYLDLFNIVMNTLFLFFSGIFCNYFYMFIFYKSITTSIFFCMCSLFTGFLFIWNQLWEFSLLVFTISTNSFCSTLYSMDLLHFSHVSLGIFFMLLSTIKLFNLQVSHMKLMFFTCIMLYWHFVDMVWFMLLSFLYFGMLSVVFLL